MLPVPTDDAGVSADDVVGEGEDDRCDLRPRRRCAIQLPRGQRAAGRNRKLPHPHGSCATPQS